MENVATVRGAGTFVHAMRKWTLRTKGLTASARTRKTVRDVQGRSAEQRTRSAPVPASVPRGPHKVQTITHAGPERTETKRQYQNHDHGPCRPLLHKIV